MYKKHINMDAYIRPPVPPPSTIDQLYLAKLRLSISVKSLEDKVGSNCGNIMSIFGYVEKMFWYVSSIFEYMASIFAYVRHILVVL